MKKIIPRTAFELRVEKRKRLNRKVVNKIVRYFGFFKGMKYGKYTDKFEDYLNIKNQLDRTDILKYLSSLPITAIAPMFTEDMFDGEAIEQAGLIEDGDFTFPTDFVHYYRKYPIGIPHEYEKYINGKIHKKGSA